MRRAMLSGATLILLGGLGCAGFSWSRKEPPLGEGLVHVGQVPTDPRSGAQGDQGRGEPGSGPAGPSLPRGHSILARRAVSAKQPPNTVMATAGSRCVISISRYEHTHVGDQVLCGWQRRE